MGSRGGAGIEIDVAHVPQRETGMTPYEIMLSESQERMLLVVKRGRERGRLSADQVAALREIHCSNAARYLVMKSFVAGFEIEPSSANSLSAPPM